MTVKCFVYKKWVKKNKLIWMKNMYHIPYSAVQQLQGWNITYTLNSQNTPHPLLSRTSYEMLIMYIIHIHYGCLLVLRNSLQSGTQNLCGLVTQNGDIDLGQLWPKSCHLLGKNGGIRSKWPKFAENKGPLATEPQPKLDPWLWKSSQK